MKSRLPRRQPEGKRDACRYFARAHQYLPFRDFEMALLEPSHEPANSYAMSMSPLWHPTL
jgi:hypothetical protein